MKRQASDYRIKKIVYKNHKEFWIEKSIRLFGIHLFWTKTTISYFRTKEYAIKYLEDALGKKLEEVIYFK